LSSGRAPLSVIIPCYRCQDTLRRALASVESQTWPPAEVLVVNDDNLLEIRKVLKEVVSAGDYVLGDLSWDKLAERVEVIYQEVAG